MSVNLSPKNKVFIGATIFHIISYGVDTSQIAECFIFFVKVLCADRYLEHLISPFFIYFKGSTSCGQLLATFVWCCQKRSSWLDQGTSSQGIKFFPFFSLSHHVLIYW